MLTILFSLAEKLSQEIKNYNVTQTTKEHKHSRVFQQPKYLTVFGEEKKSSTEASH